jgi:hypothetical protein
MNDYDNNILGIMVLVLVVTAYIGVILLGYLLGYV